MMHRARSERYTDRPSALRLPAHCQRERFGLLRGLGAFLGGGFAALGGDFAAFRGGVAAFGDGFAAFGGGVALLAAGLAAFAGGFTANWPNDAFNATASAASPLMRSDQRSSWPFRFPLRVILKPSGDSATINARPLSVSSRFSVLSSGVVTCSA
jgi:hypothetical protein